jgi:ATP-binding cassette subfamily B protein
MPADTTQAAANTQNKPQNGPDHDDFARKERQSGLLVLRKVAPYLWPKNMAWVRRRVVWALVALFISKLISVATPLFYRDAVDALAGDGVSMLALGAVGLTIAYGMARLFTVGFQQLRDAVFARVGQRALRMLALETFEHIHRLSMRYHITRKTGGLSRIIERGVKGVEFLLRFLLFSIGPLILELIMIGAILTYLFDWTYLAVVAITIAFYVWFTFAVTEWRVRLR